MNQTVFTEKEAKNNFGRLLNKVRRFPVAIKKNGRNIAYVMSSQNYSRLEDIMDAYWGKKALKAKKEGYLTVAQSNKLIQKILNA